MIDYWIWSDDSGLIPRRDRLMIIQSKYGWHGSITPHGGLFCTKHDSKLIPRWLELCWAHQVPSQPLQPDQQASPHALCHEQPESSMFDLHCFPESSSLQKIHMGKWPFADHWDRGWKTIQPGPSHIWNSGGSRGSERLRMLHPRIGWSFWALWKIHNVVAQIHQLAGLVDLVYFKSDFFDLVVALVRCLSDFGVVEYIWIYWKYTL